MQQLDLRTRERITTGRGPMDLDAGRLDVREGVKVLLLSVIAVGAAAGLLAAALLFAWCARAAGPSVLGGVCLILSTAAGLGAFVLAGGAVGLVGLQGATWVAHFLRVNRWHQAELRVYLAAGGARVDRQMSAKALTIARPLDVLAVAQSLAERARRGELAAPSAAALTGAVWVGRVQVGELSKRQAEEFVRALRQVGVITGGKPGAAGRLATTDPAEIQELVTTRAGRINALPAPADEGE